MELIGIHVPACAPAHDLPTQTSQFFIIHACSSPIGKSYVFYVTLEYF